MHRNVHDAGFREKRGDTVITRAMAVSSPTLGISGECDVVEFINDANGININGLKGSYRVVPTEYKRGEPKPDESDIMQLTAQAMCLEEMLCCEIPKGYIFYGETKHRYEVCFSDVLRVKTENTIKEMHGYYARKYTPKVKRTHSCNACSLKDICLPVLCGERSARDYIRNMLEEDDI